MNAVKIKEGVYWVGALDYNLRDFHGYTTPNGTTYNSYLIVDKKIALIDSVKAPFSEELISRISSIVEPGKIDYLIVNHVEMDHSSSIEAVMELTKKAEIRCTKKAEEFLHAHYPASSSWSIKTVAAGDSLILGKRRLDFIPVPMLHWPDSMFTYSKADKVLFSNDGFGQHIATGQRFSDEVKERDIFGEAQKYYANILMPYSGVAEKKLLEMKGLKIDVICPSHGVIFRDKEDIKRITSLYEGWAGGEAKDKAVIVYDTMYDSTEKMARAIEEGLSSKGIDTRLYRLRISDQSDAISEILDAKAVIVGSSTLNNGVLPAVGGFLTYLLGLRPRGKIGAAFGSYGWGGGAVKTIEEHLLNTGIELPLKGFQSKFVPDEDVLKASYKLGRDLAGHIKKR